MAGINKKGRAGNQIHDFLERIQINPSTKCWEWQGARDRDGYGHMGYKNKIYLVHRLAYMYYHNISESNIKNKVVMHACDNPSCVNPNHLNLGTPKDNVHDCIKKGRRVQSKGESNGNSKLTEYQVKKIKELYQLGISQEELARMFNVSRRSIYNIRNNITWNHVSSE